MPPYDAEAFHSLLTALPSSSPVDCPMHAVAQRDVLSWIRSYDVSVDPAYFDDLLNGGDHGAVTT